MLKVSLAGNAEVGEESGVYITLNNTPKLKKNTIWSLNFTMLKASKLDSSRFSFFWRPHLWSCLGRSAYLLLHFPCWCYLPSEVRQIAFRGHEYCSLIVVGCIPCHLPAGNEAWATPGNESCESGQLNLTVLPSSIEVKLGCCNFETWHGFLFFLVCVKHWMPLRW